MRPRLQAIESSIWWVLFVTLTALVFPAAGDTVKSGPGALVDGFVKAWNSHDMLAFAELFTEDADFVNVAGMWWKGRAEIQAKHQESHATGLKMSSLSALNVSMRPIGSDGVVMHFRWELTGQLDNEGQQMAARRGIMQILAVKRPDGWKIAAAQNTNAAPTR